MKKTLLFSLFLLGNLFYPDISNAQLGWQWGRGSSYTSFNEFAIAVDTSGNVFTGGETGFGYELAVIKTDPLGNYQWTITASVSTKDAVATGMVCDNTGDLYILGVYNDTMCVVMGDTLRNPTNYAMYFLLKCSSATGSILWVKNVANSVSDGAGSSGSLGKVGVDGWGNVYIAGQFDLKSITIGATTLFNTDTSGNSSDIFIAKYTSAGVPVWAKSFGGIRAEYAAENIPFSFAVTWKGDIYISGKYGSPTLYIGTKMLTNAFYLVKANTYLAKFDNSGNAIWAQSFDSHIGINGLTTDAAENIFMTGYIDSTVAEVFGKDTIISSFLGTVIYAKYDLSGTEVWAKASGYKGDAGGQSISLDYCGNLWISGRIGSWPVVDTISFDGHLVTAPIGSLGYPYYAVFLAKFDTSGNYKTSVCLPGGAGLGAQLSEISVDNKGDFYVAGNYYGTKMPFGSDTLSLPVGFQLLYIGKYKYDSINCNETVYIPLKINTATDFSGIIFYPNPATSECTIKSDVPFPTGSKAELYDLAGRIINTYLLSGNSRIISLAGIAPGMYQCRIITGNNNVVVKKLVVMK